MGEVGGQRALGARIMHRGNTACATGSPPPRGEQFECVGHFGQIAHAQELRGAEVVQVAPEPEAYEKAIDERTALVCSTLVSYRTGAVHDVEAIHALARGSGALMLVDGYQGIGAIPLAAAAAGDVVVGGTVKYLLASAGLAFMACRPGLVPELFPTQTGWFADEDIFQMDIYDYSPAPTARRFEHGTPPIPSIYAGIAGIELVQEIGVAEAQEHIRGLTAQLADGVDELGGRVVTPRDPERKGPLVAIASTDEHALVGALGDEGIVTSSRAGNLRVSFHAYNTSEDVEAVVAALARHRDLLA